MKIDLPERAEIVIKIPLDRIIVARVSAPIRLKWGNSRRALYALYDADKCREMYDLLRDAREMNADIDAIQVNDDVVAGFLVDPEYLDQDDLDPVTVDFDGKPGWELLSRDCLIKRGIGHPLELHSLIISKSGIVTSYADREHEGLGLIEFTLPVGLESEGQEVGVMPILS